MSDNVALVIGLACVMSLPVMLFVYLAWVGWHDKDE